MYSRIGTVIAIFMVTVTLCFGCGAGDNSIATTLQVLERGEARGKLIFTTDGRVSLTQQVQLGIGAGNSALSFGGDINFKKTESDEESRQKVEE